VHNKYTDYYSSEQTEKYCKKGALGGWIFFLPTLLAGTIPKVDQTLSFSLKPLERKNNQHSISGEMPKLPMLDICLIKYNKKASPKPQKQNPYSVADL